MIPCLVLSDRHACPSFERSKQLADFYQIFYKSYAIRCDPNVMHFKVLIVNNNVADARTCGMGAILATLTAVSSN